MAFELDEKNSLDATPTRFVAPQNFDIDPSTMAFAPGQYMSMLGESIKNSLGSMFQSPTTGPIQGLQEIPGQPPSFGGPIKGLKEEQYEPHPKAKPLIDAIEHGFADKKIMNPVEMIRTGIKASDVEMVHKGHTKLADMLSETNLDPMDKFLDIALGRGVVSGAQRNANKIAADVIANELQRQHGLGMPSVDETVQAGLLQPNELMPTQRPNFAHLIPDSSFAMTPEGMPVSSVSMQGIPAQPGQGAVPPTQLFISPLQQELVNSRLVGTSKGRLHSDPAGLTEFNTDVQAQVDAHIEKHGVYPDKQTYSGMVAAARKRVTEEPVKGGLHEEKLKADIAKTKADTTSTEEKTTTEVAMRPEQITESKAKTAELLSKMNLNITEASRAITRGQQAEYHAQIEGAKAGLAEMKGQIQTIAAALASGDLTKEDKIKFDQYLLDLVKSGLQISKRGGAFGLDFLDSGKPNISLSQTGQPGSSIPPAPAMGNDITMLPPANTGVDPTRFAPQPMGGMPPQAPIEAPPIPQAEQIPAPKTPEEARKLKPGTRYRRPDGKIAIR